MALLEGRGCDTGEAYSIRERFLVNSMAQDQLRELGSVKLATEGVLIPHRAPEEKFKEYNKVYSDLVDKILNKKNLKSKAAAPSYTPKPPEKPVEKQNKSDDMFADIINRALNKDK